jgi:sec-independent protein translocase protein TatA
MFGFLNIGPWELLLILVIMLIVFGPGKLPEVARALGKAIREFRKASSSVQRVWDEVTKEEPVKSTQNNKNDKGTRPRENTSSDQTSEREKSSDQHEDQVEEQETTEEKAEETTEETTESQGEAVQDETEKGSEQNEEQAGSQEISDGER